jgi:hypothetical protein
LPSFSNSLTNFVIPIGIPAVQTNKTKPLKLVNCETTPTPAVPKMTANIFVLIIPVVIFAAEAKDIFETALTILFI